MRRLPALMSASLLLAALTACASAPPEPSQEPTGDVVASSTPSPESSDAPTPSSPPPAPTAAPGPDEVVAGCSDTTAEELGDVVAGVDVDGDGARDVVRYVAGEPGAAPGEDCARTVLAYLPDTIAGIVLDDGLDLDESSVASLAPGGEGEPAYVRLRTTAARGGFQQHLYALVGSGPDAALAEVSTDGDGTPLLPFVATDSPGTRAGFLCSDGSLVGQVGTPTDDASLTLDVTTTTYAVEATPDAAVATVVDEVTSTDVQDEAVRFRFPALLPDSAADLCS